MEKAKNDGDTPLSIAAHRGHLEVARLLLDAKADKDKANYLGTTPLSIAAHRGHLEVARLLLHAKANMDKAKNDGDTPVFIAAHLEVVPPLCSLQRALTVARQFARAVGCSRRSRAV
ncbi:RIPK4 [Symbiodinium necroappetens]|uniref:RIPK4 protein n=1 Tax=Symbiodinium necroappetens TaxID=1628268 RepID=A0A812M9P0_9DINO|nr:RIPK4 [Symbiodinium necroappetens]